MSKKIVSLKQFLEETFKKEMIGKLNVSQSSPVRFFATVLKEPVLKEQDSFYCWLDACELVPGGKNLSCFFRVPSSAIRGIEFDPKIVAEMANDAISKAVEVHLVSGGE